jgi:hypothetical protein
MKMLILAVAAIAGCIPLIQGYTAKFLASWLTPQQVHINVPLSRIAVEAYNAGNFVAPALFPVVGVDKQSNIYYTINKDTWLRAVGTTLRAPKTAPRRVEFDVSSDTYFAHNYALAGDNAFEALANADDPIALRERTTAKVVHDLLLDQELRIKNKVTSISNIGSGVLLTGGSKWSDYLNSDPIADITTGVAFVRQNTGIVPNTMLLDWDTHKILRRHPALLDLFKYTEGGLVTDAQMRETFGIGRILISDAIYNAGVEGGTASITNVWGNNCLLAYVEPGAPSLRTATFGLGFRWTPEGIPAPMQTRVYDDPDPGKKVEVIEVGYYQDEKIVAAQLAYLIGNTL